MRHNPHKSLAARPAPSLLSSCAALFCLYIARVAMPTIKTAKLAVADKRAGEGHNVAAYGLRSTARQHAHLSCRGMSRGVRCGSYFPGRRCQLRSAGVPCRGRWRRCRSVPRPRETADWRSPVTAHATACSPRLLTYRVRPPTATDTTCKVLPAASPMVDVRQPDAYTVAGNLVRLVALSRVHGRHPTC